jgi:hypothetical protein
MILRVFGPTFRVVPPERRPEDVRVSALLLPGRADEDAVSLVPSSFEVGYVAEDGSA